MKEFRGKVAVITGAGSGIGRSMAERCVQEGMIVVVTDVDEARLAGTEDGLRALGGTVLSVRTDVSRRGDVETLAQKTRDAFGAVHVLVKNAGVGAGGSPWEATWNDWEWVLGVNLWGVIYGVKVFTPIMIAQETDCHIINTASIAGLTVGGSSAPYSVSKHAVVALSESLYLALDQRKSRVKVSVLCPASVKTNIVNSERSRPVELQNESDDVPPETRAYWAFMNTAVEGGISPLQVADQVFRAMREERFYILTHPEWLPVIQLRVDNLLRADNPKSSAEAIRKISKPTG